MSYTAHALQMEVMQNASICAQMVGVEPGRLDAIKAAENLPQNCLHEMLKIWLNRVSPPPSWAAIADAIDLLGDQKLADHLRTKYHN